MATLVTHQISERQSTDCVTHCTYSVADTFKLHSGSIALPQTGLEQLHVPTHTRI